MGLLDGVRAEWPLLRIRLVRTRLGLWLLLLAAALLWREHVAPSRPADGLTASLQAGVLGAMLCVGYLAGSAADRRALALLLSHPTTPGALAVGRWAAATGGAALLVLVVAGHRAWTAGAGLTGVGGALAGVLSAGAVASCGLALAWTGGNVLSTLFCVWLALMGGAPPETIIGMPHPGAVRLALAAVLEIAPAPWRYRGIARGDPGALLHAAGWIVLGLAIARARAGRLSCSLR